ncbi:MAG: DUF3592 domain-containing protein [Pseudomonadota bacterium]
MAAIGALILVFLWRFIGYLIWKDLAVSRWPSVDGQITESSIKSETYKDTEHVYHTKYQPVVEYQYEVRKRTYANEKIGILDNETDSQSEANRIQRQYAVGKVVKVYFNPRNPQDSYLEKRMGWDTHIGMVMGAIIFTYIIYETFKNS